MRRLDPEKPQLEGQKSVKYQLGEPLGSDFDTKLACQTEFSGQDGQVDVIWTAKRRQVGAQRGAWDAQRGAKGPQKRNEDH